MLLLLMMTVVMTVFLYQKAMQQEEERCWQILGESAQSLNREIKVRFEDHISILHMIVEIANEENMTEPERIRELCLSAFSSDTMFQQIDVIYPDRTVITEDGEKKEWLNEEQFQKIYQSGEHMSERFVHPEDGKNYLCYCVPVKKEGEIVFVLAGLIQTDTMNEIFGSTLYGGQAKCCIVDVKDGNYIMDEWHDTLGNAFDDAPRRKVKGYEEVDQLADIKALKTGVVAFQSRTTGKPLYMYYTPVGIFDWEISIFATRDVIFEKLLYMKKLLMIAGIIEGIIVLLYCIWNLFNIRQAIKSKAETEEVLEQLKYVSYRDMLTNLYNRNKYMEVLDGYKGKMVASVGIAYIDLNGLKKINDAGGHECGDRYIRNAAEKTEEAFPGYVYRIGGDEFVVLQPEIEKAVFERQIDLLKEKLAEVQVSSSIGFLWREFCEDLDALQKEADKIMYSEKERYYKEKEIAGKS